VTIVFSGHGWGHALGMSQWGAMGYAQHGWSYDRILAHYYPGTRLEQRGNPTMRVLLAEDAAGATLGSESAWSVTDARGIRTALEPGELTLTAALVVAGRKLTPPLTFVPKGSLLTVGGKEYRGRVVVYASGKKLQVVNTLKLEPYIKGVVGYEMPSRWPAAALQAQAVAARTYALARLSVVGPRTYDVYADTRSQVYGGVEAEVPSVSNAVDATARRVLTYGGKIITAYYFSSSGGRTASAEEALGTPVPYLVSVDDPYDTLSPNHDWGPLLFDARKIATALKVHGGLLDLHTTVGPSGHVTTVTAVGAGGEVTSTGPALRILLGLRSTWFTVGWLSLDQPKAAAYGTPAQLTGIARGAGTVTLEAKQGGAPWQTVAAVKPNASGAFSMSVSPGATTEYRLAAGDVRAALVKLAVAPVVAASVNAGAVSGTVRPALPGAAVQVQRRNGTSWATVATARPDTAGAFAVPTALGPGSYRVLWAPGRGLEPGVSQLLAVR